MNRRNKKQKRRGGCLSFLLILACFAALFMYWSTVIDVDEYPLKFANLPEAFEGYRIAVVSDLHAAEFGTDNKNLLDAVNGATPDIIAITGDITDSSGQVEGVMKTVAALLEIAPVYYVTGNHEWEKGEVRELFARLPEAGVTVMRNDVLTLEHGGDTIYLVGLEDPNGPADMKKPAEVLSQVPEGAFSITLVHRNTFLDEIALTDTSLVLCGHGHGGLIRLPFVGGLFDHNLRLFPEYTSGVYTFGEMTAVVSRGIGNNTGVPRIGNNPHIPVIILHKEQ